ncbi:unnamed protein product [Trichobilharzia szidati]|nr:unnamed protein product [Trichobilharzia szidati]
MQLQIDELKTKLSSFECIPETISLMKKELQDPTILKLFNMTSRMTPTDSENAKELENAIDFLSSEVVKRLASKQNAIVYNVPDSEPIKSVQHSLLKAANLLSAPCQCIRLSKKDLKHPCPILFRFDSYIIAERFKKAEDLLATATKFKTIKVVSDKTTNQRQATKNSFDRKLTTPRTTPGISAKVSTDTEAQQVTCIVLEKKSASKSDSKLSKSSVTGCNPKVHESTSGKPADIHEVDIDSQTMSDQKPLADHTQSGCKPESPAVETARKTTKPRVPLQTSTYLPLNKSNKQHVSLKKRQCMGKKPYSQKSHPSCE